MRPPRANPLLIEMLAAFAVATFGAPLAVGGGSALADVFEIGPQGQLTVYAAPTVFTAKGAEAIVVQSPPAPVLVSAGGEEVRSLLREASQMYAVPPGLLEAVAWRESRLRQTSVSSKGAIGVMQLMAGTARGLGVDPYDLKQNIHGGAAYLSQMLNRYRGDTTLALAAYNAGPGAVDRSGGMPPYRETQNYVAAILGHLGSVPVLQPAAFVVSP